MESGMAIWATYFIVTFYFCVSDGHKKSPTMLDIPGCEVLLIPFLKQFFWPLRVCWISPRLNFKWDGVIQLRLPKQIPLNICLRAWQISSYSTLFQEVLDTRLRLVNTSNHCYHS